MKKFIALLASLLLVVGLMACAQAPAAPDPPDEPDVEEPADPDPEPADDDDDLPEGTEIVEVGEWKIGIMTGTVTQGEEEFLAAQNMLERFGPDHIVTSTYPDDFGAEIPTTIANIQALVDAGAQAIVFVQAVPGAIAAVESVHELFGPDILFFFGVTHEPPAEVAAAADVVLISDDLSMGRVIVEQAARMGADTFAHVSFPRHLGMENIAARRELLMETAESYGMEWVEITAPDPMSEGIAQAQLFINENLPRWIEEHGPYTAFFSTNCGMQEPLITQIAAYGGLYPLQCCPSPLHALPSAFNVSIPDENAGDMDFLINALHDAVGAAGASGRISTWPVPINMVFVEVGVLYSIEYLEGRTNGRHDPEVVQRLLLEVAGQFGADIEIRNWPIFDDDGNEVDVLENMYRVLSSFVTF